MRQQVAKPGGPCWRSSCEASEALPAASIPLDVSLRAPLPLSMSRRKTPQCSWASPAAAAPQRPFTAEVRTHGHPRAPHALTERRHGAGLQQQAVLAAARLQQRARPRLLLPEQPQPFAQSHGSRCGGGREGPGGGGGGRASFSSGVRRGTREPPAAPRELLRAAVPSPGFFSQRGGPGGRPCPAAARRSPPQASECLRGAVARRRAKEAERPPRADPPLRPPPRGALAAASGAGATFPFALRLSLPTRGKLSRVNFVPAAPPPPGQVEAAGGALPPALPAGEGRSGGRAAELGQALWAPARPGCSRLGCSRLCLSRPGGAAPHPRGWRRSPSSRRERGRPSSAVRRRGCSLGRRAALLPASSRAPGAAPRWQGAPLGAAFPRYKEFRAKTQFWYCRAPITIPCCACAG